MENEVRQIQLKCLEILNVVDEICHKNAIEHICMENVFLGMMTLT